MRTLAIGMLCAVLTLALVGTANAVFLETFDGMAVPDQTDLVGQTSGANTWGIPFQLTNTSAKLKANAGLNGASRGCLGNSASSRGNSIAIEAGTITAGAGTFVLTMDMLDDPLKYVGLGVGTSSINDFSTPQNWLASRLNDGGLYDRFYSKTNDVYIDDPAHAITLVRATNTWKNFKIEVDLDASSIVTAARQYIDGALAGTWSFGATPTWTPTHVAFVFDNSGAVQDPKGDNFSYYWVPQILGDVNGDGFVGGADITQIVGNWGLTSATRRDGDLDGSGTVGVADYTEVYNNWGNGTLPSEPPLAIPEPSALLLLAGGVLAGLIRRG